MTLKQIMKLIPRKFSYASFRYRVNRIGLKRNVSEVKLPKTGTYNLDYWEIPNLKNCYFAGHIAADGCIMKSKTGICRMSLFAAIKDECVIDNYIRELNFKGKKIVEKNHGFSSEKKDLWCCKIVLSSFDKNAGHLKKHFNLEPRKTERLGPTNLDNIYLNMAYLVGLIDGDGSVSISSQRKDGHTTIQVSCGSCSKAVIEWMRDLLNDNFPNLTGRVPADLSFHKINSLWSFGISGLRAAVIIDYLRQLPLQDLRLKRKWDNPEILSYIEEKKRLRPEVFRAVNQSELLALMPQAQSVSSDAPLAQNQFNMPNLALNQEYIPQSNMLPLL